MSSHTLVQCAKCRIVGQAREFLSVLPERRKIIGRKSLIGLTLRADSYKILLIEKTKVTLSERHDGGPNPI